MYDKTCIRCRFGILTVSASPISCGNDGDASAGETGPTIATGAASTATTPAIDTVATSPPTPSAPRTGAAGAGVNNDGVVSTDTTPFGVREMNRVGAVGDVVHVRQGNRSSYPGCGGWGGGIETAGDGSFAPKVVTLNSVAAAGLRSVEGTVGAPNDVPGRLVARTKFRQTEADGNVKGTPVFRELQLLDRTTHSVRKRDGAVELRTRQNEAELLAAIAPDVIDAAAVPGQLRRDRFQHPIPCRVTVCIVDGLEVINVHDCAR